MLAKDFYYPGETAGGPKTGGPKHWISSSSSSSVSKVAGPKTPPLSTSHRCKKVTIPGLPTVAGVGVTLGTGVVGEVGAGVGVVVVTDVS